MGSFDEYLKKYDKQAGYSEGKGYKGYIEAEDLPTKAMNYAQKAVPYAQKQIKDLEKNLNSAISNMGNVTSQTIPQYQNKPKPAPQIAQPNLRVDTNTINNLYNNPANMTANPQVTLGGAAKQVLPSAAKGLSQGGYNLLAGVADKSAENAAKAIEYTKEDIPSLALKSLNPLDPAAKQALFAKVTGTEKQLAKSASLAYPQLKDLTKWAKEKPNKDYEKWINPNYEYTSAKDLLSPKALPIAANVIGSQAPQIVTAMLTGGSSLPAQMAAVGGLGAVQSSDFTGLADEVTNKTGISPVASERELQIAALQDVIANKQGSPFVADQNDVGFAKQQLNKAQNYDGTTASNLGGINSVVSSVSGALDALPLVRGLRRTGVSGALEKPLNKIIKDVATGKPIKKNALVKFGENVGKEAAEEFFTGGAQEGLSIAGEKVAGVNDAGFLENLARMGNSAALEGFGGGVGGAAFHLAGSKNRQQAYKDEAKQRDLINKLQNYKFAEGEVQQPTKIESIAPKTAAKQNKTTEQVTEQVTEQASEPAAKESLTADNNTFTSYKDAFKEMKKRGKGFTVVNNNDGTYTVALTGNVTKNVQNDVKENAQTPSGNVAETKYLNKYLAADKSDFGTELKSAMAKIDSGEYTQEDFETLNSLVNEFENEAFDIKDGVKIVDELRDKYKNLPLEDLETYLNRTEQFSDGYNPITNQREDLREAPQIKVQTQSTQTGEMVETPATLEQNQIADTSKKVETPKTKVEELAPNIAKKQKQQKEDIVKQNLIKELDLDTISAETKPEYSKEMRDEAINIIASATGKKPAYIQMIAKSSTGNKGVATKRSKLQELMEGGSENITADGIGEGLKYYNKKGLTYDDADIEAGYDVINQAFDDLVNDNFYVNKEENSYDNMLGTASNKVKGVLKNIINDPEGMNNIEGYTNEVANYIEENVPEEARTYFYDEFYNGLDKISDYLNKNNKVEKSNKAKTETKAKEKEPVLLNQTGEKSGVNAYDTRTEEVNKLTEVVYDKLGEVLNLSKEALAEKLNAGIVENAEVKTNEGKLTQEEQQKAFEAEYVDKKQIAEDEQKLEKGISLHLEGKLPSGKRIYFGKAPYILQDYGVPNLPMFMDQNKYDCSTHRKVVDGSIHNISDEVMKKFPSLLSDPLMIAYPTDESDYKGNSRIVVSLNAKDLDQKIINVIIDYDWTGQKVNIIPSAYGKDDFADYVKTCDKENKIIYTDRKNLLSHCGEVQSLKRSSKGSNNSITDKEDLFNPPKKLYQTSEPTSSKEFKNWFGDSKVVDENGKPLVVYHGTPNAGFKEFKNNSHFTANKEYAENYKSQGASSISYKKTANNPDVYEVYLSIQNPFDTRDKKARDIFKNEYRAYYSPELTDKGMVDWLEVEELTDWLKENHPEYDGIFADEGGTGGYGGKVKDRGISYVPFSPEQIKSVDNKGSFDKNNPNIYYQKEPNKNLLMVHATKAYNVDDIIKSGSLVAPSMAVIKNDTDNINFGDVVFVRNPQNINVSKDNIYTRDIYSARMPKPLYKTNNGYNSTIGDFEYDSMKRQWEENPEKFKEKHYGMTFDEYFKDAEKVLFKGFTPAGKRKYVPYTPQNIIKEMKEAGLQNGEKWSYGLNSFLASLARKAKNMNELKDLANENLGKVAEEVIDNLKEQYFEVESKLRQYAKDDYKGYEYFSDIYPEVLKAIYKNDETVLNRYMDKIDSDIIKETKDFVSTAIGLKRTYFEAKPMREVSLSEFPYALAPKGKLTEEQIKGLKDLGVEVVEYDNIKDGIKTINEKYSDVLFQNEQEPKGAYNPDQNVIEFFKKADSSTSVHEVAHWMLNTWQKLESQSPEIARDLKSIRKFVGNKGGEFTTEQHEKFARGFEAYIRDGKAETPRLQKAFERFKKALQAIYKSLRDIVYNQKGKNKYFTEKDMDNINTLFNRIFTTEKERRRMGLDKVKQVKAEKVKAEPKTTQEIESDIENTAKELEGVKQVKRSVLKDVGRTIEKAITPISTRLEKINPVLKYAIRKFEYKLGQAENDYASQAKPFLDKLQEFSKKNPRDYKVYDLALKNGNKEHIDYLNKKYGLTGEYKQLRNLMDTIRQDAIDSGMDVGLIEEYYPRRFTDANKFLTEIQKHTQVAAKLKEYTNLSNEDKAIKINNALKGIGGVISSNSSHTKSRKIKELQAIANAYYKDSQVALGEYIANMNKKIQIRKFFGQDSLSVSQLRTKLRNKKNTLDEVKGRSAAQSKFKELSRLKYELAPLKVKLESYNKQTQTPEIKEEVTKLKDKIEWLENQINWVNKTKDTIIHNVVKKRLREDIAAIEDDIKAKQNGNLEDSIGSYVKNLIDNNQITAEQENELKEILAARFNEKGMSESVAAFKNAGLITSMANGINSAITQIGDFAWTLYRNGFINSMAGLKEQFKDSGLTKQDLGIDKIAQEFETDSKSGKLVSNLFEKVGLEFIDSLGKETFINGTLESLRQEARKPSKEFTEKLNKMFDNPEQVITDLKNGVVNDDIKYLLFNEISDFQPITNAEMPQTYLTAGNGRIVYTLKSYTIKQFDVLRRECFDKYKKAQNDYKNAKTKEEKTKAKEDIKKSITDTIKLVSLIVVLNGGADAAKDFLLGRKFNLEDTFIDNILKLAFLNKFTTDKASKQGLWSMFVTSNFSIPQLAWLDDIGHDYKATMKAIDKNEDLGETIKDYKVWKNTPLVGKHYYNMLGGGAANKEKYQKQDDRAILQKEYMKPNNASGIMKAQRELQKKGYSAKDLKKMRDSASSTVKKRYKEKYVNAIERGDSRAIASISRELQNTSLSPAERSKIYSSARKKALENKRRK